MVDLRATRTDDPTDHRTDHRIDHRIDHRADHRTQTATGGTATLLAPDRPGPRAGDLGEHRDEPDADGWEPQDVRTADQAAAHAPAPRSNLAIWLVLAGVVASVLLGVLAGSRAGVLGVSATLAVCAAVRAVLPGPGPVGIAIRGRVLDVMMFAGLATAIFVLGVSAPGV